MKILLIEDEKITRITLSDTLRREGYEVVDCDNGASGLEAFEQSHFDVVLTDLRLPKTSGLDILKTVKEKRPHTSVLIMTAFATVETAVQALKLGAYDYLTKPFSPDELLSMLTHIKEMHEIRSENKQLKKRIKSFENRFLVGNAPVMRKLAETIKAVAKRDYSILIEGQSGTGKEMVARTLHKQSKRAKEAFVAVNCAAIPETLLESELFGHEKGAFSGAHKQHRGYFERANNGTLFIDDIDDFPLTLQVKLLRVLQEKECIRVGGSHAIQLNIRIICATKVDLLEQVKKNLFREDLYYRLNIIPIKLAPLAERKEDIPALVEHFLEKHGAGDQATKFSTEVYNKLIKYNWPGNVRELENVVERLIALPALDVLNLLEPASVKEESSAKTAPLLDSYQNESYASFMRKKEEEIIRWALKQAGDNISKAAKILSLPRSTLRSKLEKWQDA